MCVLSVTLQKCHYPKEIPWHVSLAVAEPRPPPLGLQVVRAPEDGEGLPLAEGQLIGLLGVVVPEGEGTALVHHAELLLHTCSQRNTSLVIWSLFHWVECVCV